MLNEYQYPPLGACPFAEYTCCMTVANPPPHVKFKWWAV